MAIREDIVVSVLAVTLLISSWTLYLASRHGRWSLDASPRLSQLIEANQTAVRFTETLLATTMAILTTYLFSRSVSSYLLTRIISKSMTLHDFCIGVQLIQRSVVWNVHKKLGLMISLVVVGLAGLITPAWNALISPIRLRQERNLSTVPGAALFDIDMFSPEFPAYNQAVSLPEVNDTTRIFYNTVLPRTSAKDLAAAGLSAAKQLVGLEDAALFNQFSFKGPSQGVFPRGPAGLLETHEELELFSLEPYTYVIHNQQGSTVNVTCTAVDPTVMVPDADSVDVGKGHDRP